MPLQKTPMRHVRIKKTASSNHRWWLIIGSILACVVLAITIGYYWRSEKTNALIADDITRLQEIFKTIEEHCGIVGFDHDINYVDFLTIGSFAGSNVGAMHIKNRDQWHGPYLQDNPLVQEKLYEIMRTNKGYFLIPGHGVTLNDGRVIGRDIILTYDSDIQELIHNGILCTHDGKPLACAITLKEH